MFAFNLLGVNFSDRMSSGRKLTVVDSNRIGREVHETKGGEQLLQVDKDLICSTPKYIGQDHPSQMINRMP